MVRKVGNGVTTDKKLTTVGRSLIGECYIGTFPVDVKPIYLIPPETCKRYSFILNVDGSNKAGSHWLAVVRLPNIKKYIIYDSFARKSKRLIPKFIKTIGFEYIDINKKSDQYDFEDNCGARCLAFILFINRNGYHEAKRV